MAFDTFIFGMMILDVLLRNGFFRPGRIDRVAFPTKFPGVGFNEFLRFGTFDVLVTGSMATLARQVAVVTLIFHRGNRVVTAFTTFVADKMDWKGRNLSH